MKEIFCDCFREIKKEELSDCNLKNDFEVNYLNSASKSKKSFDLFECSYIKEDITSISKQSVIKNDLQIKNNEKFEKEVKELMNKYVNQGLSKNEIQENLPKDTASLIKKMIERENLTHKDGRRIDKEESHEMIKRIIDDISFDLYEFILFFKPITSNKNINQK